MSVKYLGELDENNVPDRYVEGVPARDLPDDEWEALPEETRKRALEVRPPLYRIEGRAPALPRRPMTSLAEEERGES